MMVILQVFSFSFSIVSAILIVSFICVIVTFLGPVVQN